MRRVTESVPMAECERRALAYAVRSHPIQLLHASDFIHVIWPGSTLSGQGGGGAASRVLRRLRDKKLIDWVSRDNDWGYKATAAGRAAVGTGV